jgi:hypothetical protein
MLKDAMVEQRIPKSQPSKILYRKTKTLYRRPPAARRCKVLRSKSISILSESATLRPAVPISILIWNEIVDGETPLAQSSVPNRGQAQPMVFWLLDSI